MGAIMHNRSSIVKHYSYPLKHMVRFTPAPGRPWGAKVTLCIAGICDSGRHVICIADGMLSDMVSGASGDARAIKTAWIGEWIFMFSGVLSNSDLIMEEVRQLTGSDAAALTRASILTTLRSAYKKHMAKWSADRNLAPYDLSMEEFKKNGRGIFGEERFAELSRSIENDVSQNYNEQILAIGYGKTEHAAAVFSMGRWGLGSHNLDGFAVIGSGTSSALSSLLLNGYSRQRPFEEALYLVCAAKFGAEGRDGVGRSTFLCVAHKGTEKDDKDQPPAQIIQADEIAGIRKAWERYGQPEIPAAGLHETDGIARRLGLPSPENMVRMVNSSGKAKAKITSEKLK